MQKICVRLQQALDARGLKSVDVCNMTGIPRASMSVYLNGKVEPKAMRIHQLSKALDISEVWLLGYEGVQMERSEEQKEADQFGALASVLQENIELRKLCLKISKLPADRLALIQQLVDTMTP